MKKLLFFGIVLAVSLSLFNCGKGNGKIPTNPREVADQYIKEAHAGNVSAVENLSTERYKKRAKREVKLFGRYSNWTYVKVETKKVSKGTWHAHHYKCEKTDGGIQKVVVAVLEKDGKYLVGDVD